MQESRLESAPTLEQVEDQDNDRKHEEDVNPPTESRAADQSYDPEKEENDCDRPEHLIVSPVAWPLVAARLFVPVNPLPSIRCEV